MDNASDIAFIGFGEAAMAFVQGASARASAYDRKTDVTETRAAKQADYDRAGVDGAATNAEAIAGASAILSLVTADEALNAARETAKTIARGVLFLDMNSVAPETKRTAARAIEDAGGRYVDVAVMAPVHPKRRSVPLLAAGPHASAAAGALGELGFDTVRSMDRPVGAASAVKMIRSVMVKGMEALTAEMALAAEASGVTADVLASLDASWPGADWAAKTDYNLERMMAHGLRRAAEMEEAVKTLETLGTGTAMTRGTIERQRKIGAMRLQAPDGLAAKLAAVLNRRKDEAA